jgi:hypothetical protein
VTSRGQKGAVANFWDVRRFSIVAAVLVLVRAAPAAAQNQQLFNDFKDDGQVNPCAYSPGQLRKGLKGLPPDIKQYAPGLADQLRRPCGRAPAPVEQQEVEQQAAPGPPSAGPPRADIPKPPSPNVAARRAIDAPVPAASTGPTGADAPGWLVALLVALGVGALAALVANRYGGWSPEGLSRRLRAGFIDASGRGTDAALELRERLTPGR